MFVAVFSPDGHTVLDVIFGLAGGSQTQPSFDVNSGWQLSVQSVSYTAPPIKLQDACNLVVPWEDVSRGSGSLSGTWYLPLNLAASDI